MCIFIFTTSSLAFAKDVWIHAIGVNEEMPSQNYGDFYRSANYFESVCSDSTRKPECHLFLNEEKTLMPTGGDPIELNLTRNSGAPSAEALKALILDKFSKAERGDMIVISLKNHGAPVAGQSSSCIWLSARDYICDKDLAEILKSKPAGVKVLIDADACFSGAFANAASPEVCVAVGSDQLNTGSLATHGLWDQIKTRRPKSLYDLREPVFKESGAQIILTSQLALGQLCQNAREKIGRDLSISNLSFLLSYEDGLPNKCDPNYNAAKVTHLVKSVMNILEQVDSKTCEALMLPQEVCAARERLKKSGLDIKTASAQLAQVFGKKQEDTKIIFDAFKAMKEQTKNLSSDELRELTDSAELSREPNWSKFSIGRRAIARDLWRASQKLQEQLKQVEGVDTPLLKQFKEKGYYDDLLTVQGCLFQHEPVEPETQANPENAQALRYFRAIQKSFPPRRFTESDFKDAKTCESSIHFL